jgi:predicted DNA-binding protein with PD1-like motif
MKTQTLTRNGGKLQAVIFERGDEVVGLLTEFARKNEIRAARFTAIGAFQSATLAYFDWETKKYVDIPVEDQTEVLVLTGDLAWEGEKPVAHIHAVLGRRDGSTVGGHLKRAIVRPTLELMIDEAGALERKFDPASGIALIAPK